MTQDDRDHLEYLYSVLRDRLDHAYEALADFREYLDTLTVTGCTSGEKGKHEQEPTTSKA